MFNSFIWIKLSCNTNKMLIKSDMILKISKYKQINNKIWQEK